MMKRQARRATLTLHCLLLIITFGAAARGAQDEAWIKVEQGPSYELRDTADETDVRIPVTLAKGIRPEDVSLKLLDVRYGKRYDANLLTAFKVPPKVAALPGLGPAINITVVLKTASAQGGYGLLLEATTLGHRVPQLLVIEIVHPPAKLLPVETIIIEQTIAPFREPVVEGMPLLLVEDSGDTRMTDISIQPLNFYGASNQPNKGTLSFENVPQQIGPRGSHAPTYKLNGDFPLGTVKGSALVNSPQLVSPTLLSFEIHTRRASWLLFIIIGFGLLLGYLSRTVLRHRIQLNEAREKMHELIARIGSEMQRYPDEDFNQQAQNIVDELRPALAKKDLTIITAATQRADDAFRAKLKELETRRLAAQQTLDAVAAITDHEWYVPEEIRSSLNASRETKEDARRELEQDKIKSAMTKLKALPATLGAALETPVSDWKINSRLKLDRLTDGDNLPRVLTRRIKSDVETLRSLIAGVRPNELSSVGDIQKTIRAVHDTRKTEKEMLKRLAKLVVQIAEEFDTRLRQAKVPDLTSLDRLKEAVSSFSNELMAQSDQPEKALEMLTTDKLLSLKKTWREALLNQTAHFEPSEKEAVEKLLDAGEYIEAADRAVSIWTSMKGRGTLGKSAPPALVENRLLTLAGPLIPYHETTLAPAGAPSIIRAQELPPKIETSRVRTLRQLAADKLLQTTIIGALITLAGYIVFEPRFIGTFPEIAAAFFWGFSLDVTMDTLIERTKGSSQ